MPLSFSVFLQHITDRKISWCLLSRKMTFKTVIFFAFLLSSVSSYSADWCTGQFTCQTEDLFEQQQGVHSGEECQELCEVVCYYLPACCLVIIVFFSQMVAALHTPCGSQPL
jgi:hypothetical protein